MFNHDFISFSSSVEKVVVRLQGGLGNQMFQYALGEAIKKSTGIDVEYLRIKAPLIGQSSSTKRKLGIKNFSQVNDSRIHNFQNLFSEQTYEVVIQRLYNNKVSEVWSEIDLGKLGQPSVLGAQLVALDGYWQSEVSFMPAKSLVLTVFRSLKKPSAQYTTLSQFIVKEDAIGVHVRRGDYVTNSKAAKFHGFCSLEYFQCALSLIENNQGTRTVVIFSDDPLWVSKNLAAPNRIVVSKSYNLSAVEELLLMSECSDLVISNSSFSWWSAYLREESPRRAPIIVAPNPWFANPSQLSIRRPSWIELDINSGLILNQSE